MSLLSSRVRLACALLLCGGVLSPIRAQMPAPSPSPVSASPEQEKSYLAFRQGMTIAMQKADHGDTAGAGKALGDAVAAGQYHFELPKLSHVLTDNETKVPGSVMKQEAAAKGMPFWVLEALVRTGQIDAAKQAAEKQEDPESRYRALSLVAVAQAGRYVNAAYVLPPVVEEAPEKWVARTEAPGTTPGMVRALRVTSLNGPIVAPLLDCRSLEKQGTIDNDGAYATLREAMTALQPTHQIWLYRELAEIQGKMGDKPGALTSVQTAAESAVADWPAIQKGNDKTRRDVTRQEMSLLATDIEALGDKPGAERLRKVLSKSDFQQIGLPLFITINVGALLIAFWMRRASRVSWASRAGESVPSVTR